MLLLQRAVESVNACGYNRVPSGAYEAGSSISLSLVTTIYVISLGVQLGSIYGLIEAWVISAEFSAFLGQVMRVDVDRNVVLSEDEVALRVQDKHWLRIYRQLAPCNKKCFSNS